MFYSIYFWNEDKWVKKNSSVTKKLSFCYDSGEKLVEAVAGVDQKNGMISRHSFHTYHVLLTDCLLK